jgi:hypothetical protein
MVDLLFVFDDRGTPRRLVITMSRVRREPSVRHLTSINNSGIFLKVRSGVNQITHRGDLKH